ncbi:dihydrodipicolinate synthase/N-acetylneuraminate lyase [Tamaricihabitans halophyticus]|uniref:Dihydrodipicolinate synthase/N-acetylneuraminate lyase n=1 Tax=Tamaricihabitans halophyticus TaxID=1262583 RepID=A0A4R2QEB5_9PSEU|nr:dihydrodipicolinate synthase family protein [Tamaricihabitans halophyticus]TCP46804.1 dihydrodipicolinate synthase/N-acetylneuraminate lyase [Tamaricihabitans halophyticus]
MTTLTAAELRGIWASALLPLDQSDEIDYARLDAALAVQLASGVQGIYTNGTAGEFHTLTEAEYDRLHELVTGRCADAGVPVQLGASQPSGQLSLDRIRRAARLRPAAIQVILPDWLPLHADEVRAAVHGMAEAADGVPLVLYQPPYAKTQVDPVLYGRLATEVPALIGIKVPGGDDDWYARMAEHAGGLAIFVAGHTLASGYARGAVGSYANVACLHPAGAARWYGLMRTDLSAALAAEGRLRAFFDEHIAPLAAEGYCDPALDKTLAAIGDWAPIGTRVRWPHRSVDPAVVTGLRAAATKAIPEFVGR